MLEDLVILDLGQRIAAPLCAMLLGDMGANVIKVEPPTGDHSRQTGQSWIGENSTFYLSMNRNKRSICVDLRTDGGKQVLERLIARADGMVESGRTGWLEEMGFGADTIKQINPDLVTCSVSAFGRTGEFKDMGGVDLLGQAAGGLVDMTGDPGGGPVPVGVCISDAITGFNACIGLLGALLARKGKPGGGFMAVDVSLASSTLSSLMLETSSFLNTGRVPRRQGGAYFEQFPADIFPTLDGWIAIITSLWGPLCNAVGLPRLAEDVRFQEISDRILMRPELKVLLSNALRMRTTAQWLDILAAEGIMCSNVNSIPDALAAPTTKERDMVLEMTHPVYGTVRAVDSAMKFSYGAHGASDVQKPSNPPPMLGEHTIEILGEFGFSEEDIGTLCQSQSVRVLPPLEQARPTRP